MNSDFFGHEWDDLPIIFTSDGVTGENDLSMIVTSDEVKIIDKSHHELRKKSSFSVTNDYFISCTLSFILNTQFRWKQSPTAHFTIVAKDSISLWRHHSWSVTSQLNAKSLWRHIRRLFLHAQIGAKAIFTCEWQPWVSISHHPISTA